MEVLPTPVSTEIYPVEVVIPYPERSSRGLALANILFMIPKMIILIPHIIALWALSIIAMFVWIFGQWAVLFTGKYPRSFFDYLVSMIRWNLRVSAYIYGLTDKYPPFKFE